MIKVARASGPCHQAQASRATWHSIRCAAITISGSLEEIQSAQIRRGTDRQTMTTKMRFSLLLIMLASFTASTSASAPTYLYQAKLVQAAPGKLLEMIELQKSRLTEYRNAGE